jgi:DNA repair exonuclease SbcCD ATPase subunit
MGKLIIKKVVYKGDRYSFESPEFKGGLNIVEGKNGNGKSTFMNLINFGLSGKIDEFTLSNRETHSEIIEDKNNYVSLDINLNGSKYTLVRYINSNDITVLSENGEAKVFPINRSKNEKDIFSDWMLLKLEIEPVEVFQGINSSKINFRDLLRLIFHNQELNPKKIYKPADSENFISDSELIRKIIFELLVGKTFIKYYSTLAKYKEKEKERNVAKAMLEGFISSVNDGSTVEDLNLIFLKKEFYEKESQLEKLYIHRNTIKNGIRPKNQFFVEINDIKTKILDLELNKLEKARGYNEVVEELRKL